MTYNAPIQDMAYVLKVVAGFDAARARGLHPEADDELLASLLEPGARFAAEVIAPLNRTGDRTGAKLENGVVRMPPGFADAYRAWVEGGWNTVDMPEHLGGMGLPASFQALMMEMWTAASLAFGLSPILTQGGVEALEAHASPELIALYGPKLTTGEWTGAMDLTEPQAGSDLGLVRTRAEPAGDGTYRLFGQKIFITFGDHDMAENVVHFVLARLPGAPEGSKGLSLFLVPKFIPDAEGRPGQRNDIQVAGLEEKLGIHASPTCVIVFGEAGGATAWLIGEPHAGLAGMFTMMNRARLSTGLQGVALAERASQKAWAYARERRQGHAGKGEGTDPIIEHPDVRRMLLDMRAMTMAARSVAYLSSVAIDAARAEPGPEAEARAALLTPIVKAFCTDMGVEVASIGVQVHGGMGYIEETGAAQYYRDARITPIYEGTNGIQAIDLVSRKVVRDKGAAARLLIAELEGIVDAADGFPARDALAEAVGALERATAWLVAPERSAEERLAPATPYLRLFGVTLAGALLVKGALAEASGPFAKPADMAVIARHYANTQLRQAPALAATVTAGKGALFEPEALSGYG